MIRTLTLLCLLAGGAHADPAAWHVTDGNGGELWLLGSVHYLRDRDYPLPAVIDDLYDRSDAIVMELDLDDVDAADLQTRFLSAALLSGGRTLGDVLDREIYELALERSRSLGVDLTMLERFEPWLVAITIMDLGMSQLGYRPERGLEQYYLSRARADGKEVLGLETLEAQISVFADLSEREQQSLLDQTLRELDSANDAMGELIRAWREGALESLTETLVEDFDEFPGLYESLVVQRNENWLGALQRLMGQRQRFLVVVGALHLVGDGSVVELLRSRGFEVTPL